MNDLKLSIENQVILQKGLPKLQLSEDNVETLYLSKGFRLTSRLKKFIAAVAGKEYDSLKH